MANWLDDGKPCGTCGLGSCPGRRPEWAGPRGGRRFHGGHGGGEGAQAPGSGIHEPGRERPRLTLDRLRVGQSARIREVNGVGAIRRRLLEMGVLPGTELTLERISPLGDPIEVQVRGYRLSLRRNEAAHILMDGPVTAPAKDIAAAPAAEEELKVS